MKVICQLVSAACFLFIGCKGSSIYEEQLMTTQELLKALESYDTTRVNGLTGVNPARIGEDSSQYNFKLRASYKLLAKHTYPQADSFVINEYPVKSMDQIDVKVPITNKETKKENGFITIRFVKFLPPSKIAFFNLETTQWSNEPIQAPVIID